MDGLEARLSELRGILFSLMVKVERMAATLDDVVQKVTQQNTVIQSAITLLHELKVKLDGAIASGDMGKVQQIADALDSQDQALATAVTANTPTP